MSRKHINISDEEFDLFLSDSGISSGDLPVVPPDVESRILESIRHKSLEEKKKSALRFRLRLVAGSGLAAAVVFAVLTFFYVEPYHRNESGGVKSVRVTGEAYISKGGRRTALSERTVLSADDVIQTGAGSGVSFSTGDDVGFRIAQKTRLSVRSYDARVKELVLDEGEVSISLSRRASGERFMLMTDAAVVQVVGTSFSVVRNHDSTGVSVSEGKVRITTRGKEPVSEIISSGSSAVITSDGIRVTGPDRPEKDRARERTEPAPHNDDGASASSAEKAEQSDSSIKAARRDDMVINPSSGHGYFVTRWSSWDAAEEEALRAGGHLVKLDTADEEVWIRNTFGSREYFWIGLVWKNSAWVWTRGGEVVYSNWSPGQPDRYNGVESAGVMNWGGSEGIYSSGWNDLPPSRRLRGIVEIDNP